MPKKINLEKEAEIANSGAEVEGKITETLLLELCPKPVLTRFKKAITPAARADLLYTVTKTELKELRDEFKKMDDFVTKLEQWFIQELPDDQTGVSGKSGRVEIKKKEIATVEDWTAFYAHIKKKGEFDLLNKAVNQKAVQERWGQNKNVPGTTKFVKKVISLTGVKSK